MAPTKTVKSKFAARKSDKSTSKGSGKPLGGSSGIRKSKLSKGVNRPPPKQQKTKASTGPPKKKRIIYTEQELGLPKLNTITPVGVDLPKGKKKGKVFVDDQARCAIPFTIVNASKEGQIESKMIKSRQLEEIREARRKEAEARQQQRNSKLEETKDALRQKKKRKSESSLPVETSRSRDRSSGKKRVSFA
ncbi:MAG: hypothetical protein Q9173_002626 [Seirophora scorigena]